MKILSRKQIEQVLSIPKVLFMRWNTESQINGMRLNRNCDPRFADCAERLFRPLFGV